MPPAIPARLVYTPLLAPSSSLFLVLLPLPLRNGYSVVLDLQPSPGAHSPSQLPSATCPLTRPSCRRTQMKCTAPRSATMTTTHLHPRLPSSTITTRLLSSSPRPHQVCGLPATMKASWRGRETSRPAYPRKNALPLSDGRPQDPSYSIRACPPDHSPPRFPSHRHLCTPNPHIPFRPRDPPNVPIRLSTINQQADSARPPRPLRRSPSPHPSLSKTSALHHPPRRNALPSPP